MLIGFVIFVHTHNSLSTRSKIPVQVIIYLHGFEYANYIEMSISNNKSTKKY